jgi:hypothetical protein
MRVLVGTVGVVVAAYGGWLLVSNAETSDLAEVAIWLSAGVILHDLVLTPTVLVVVWLGARLLPSTALGPAAVGLLVLGSVTLVAIPVLGRFGEVPSDPTHLDRDYVAGWSAVVGLVLTGVVLATLVVRSRTRRSQVTAQGGCGLARGE